MKRIGLLAALLAGLAMPAWAQDTAAGEYIVRAADCVACHSAPGGKAFAGGLKMGTPLGTISATNITPDIETGIGSYTLEDFDRAVRRGIARDGHHLYPVMPYPSYAKLSDADVAAMYEYFMRAVRPVRQVNPPNEIPLLLSMRWPMAIWNAVFTESPGFKPDPRHDAQWNRGAYLVEGPGHCGACHTPRGWAMQEKALGAADAAYLAWATLDDWSAPSLRQNKATGLGGWTEVDIAAFLKTGRNAHSSAFGSMRDVINNSTPYLSDVDLAAIAVYLKSLPASAAETAYSPAPVTTNALYASHCQSCHREAGEGAPPFMPPLAGNAAVVDPDPASLINITLNGAAPLVVKGRPDAYRMPQFREQLSNQQIAEILSFIRSAWGNHAAAVPVQDVAEQRKRTDPASDRVVFLRMR